MKLWIRNVKCYNFKWCDNCWHDIYEKPLNFWILFLRVLALNNVKDLVVGNLTYEQSLWWEGLFIKETGMC